MNMSEKTKSVMGGAVPRWATAISMSLCAFFLSRTFSQLDSLVKVVSEQQTVIAVMRAESKYATDVLSKLNDLGASLDRRIYNLEKRNPN